MNSAFLPLSSLGCAKQVSFRDGVVTIAQRVVSSRFGKVAANRRPLAGIRIVDFGQVILLPFATRWLAWLGAEVILIESRKRAFQRITPPFAYNKPGPNTGARFNTMNNNKLGCTLNLKAPEAIALVKKLITKSDVVTENFSTGTMDKLGLGYEALIKLNSSLIYLSASAFGRTGPWRDYIGYHSSVNAFSGIAQITGYENGPPRLLGAVLPDTIGGIYITYALLLSLINRQRTGKGAYVDFSMLEGMLSLMPQPIIDFTLNNKEWTRVGNRDPVKVPHGIYRCRGEDQWVSISVGSQPEWQRFCVAIGRQGWLEDKRFADEQSRRTNAAELDALIDAWSAEQDPNAAAQVLQAGGVAAGSVVSIAQLLEDKHLNDRGFVVEVDHPESGVRKTVGLPWKIDGVLEPDYGRSPLLGESNDYVFKDLLGLSDEDIEELKKKDVIE
jgi:crotonobetainyl-CoA:carnitine CoA-transferase CaiB-like acyl-CoA transferase